MLLDCMNRCFGCRLGRVRSVFMWFFVFVVVGCVFVSGGCVVGCC